MKDRGELYQEIIDKTSPSLDDMEVAVDCTTYAIVAYIDNFIEQWGDTPVTGQVLMTLRNNALQFVGNQ